jgi:hypothetical protein
MLLGTLHDKGITNGFIIGKLGDEVDTVRNVGEVIDVTSRVRNVEIKVIESYALDASHRNNHLLVPLQRWLLTHNGKGFQQPTPTISWHCGDYLSSPQQRSSQVRSVFSSKPGTQLEKAYMFSQRGRRLCLR